MIQQLFKKLVEELKDRTNLDYFNCKAGFMWRFVVEFLQISARAQILRLFLSKSG